jgi:hypothetical protein
MFALVTAQFSLEINQIQPAIAPAITVKYTMWIRRARIRQRLAAVSEIVGFGFFADFGARLLDEFPQLHDLGIPHMERFFRFLGEVFRLARFHGQRD